MSSQSRTVCISKMPVKPAGHHELTLILKRRLQERDGVDEIPPSANHSTRRWSSHTHWLKPRSKEKERRANGVDAMVGMFSDKNVSTYYIDLEVHSNFTYAAQTRTLPGRSRTSSRLWRQSRTDYSGPGYPGGESSRCHTLSANCVRGVVRGLSSVEALGPRSTSVALTLITSITSPCSLTWLPANNNTSTSTSTTSSTK